MLYEVENCSQSLETNTSFPLDSTFRWAILDSPSLGAISASQSSASSHTDVAEESKLNRSSTGVEEKI
ncbi:hypothetical protein L6452_02544 [Arctium lappa]|uniref:Uncharacterized protein n=1 Tax=Arctium lappa TaxID=4217 RepID=A0ACB9FK84_ARCLA|nr:hypothetical protein L6452_02544 [Arctium lappa]